MTSLTGALVRGAAAGAAGTTALSWSASSWVSDVVPHVAYGAVTAALLRALVT